MKCIYCELPGATVELFYIQIETPNGHRISVQQKKMQCLVCVEGFVPVEMYDENLAAIRNHTGFSDSSSNRFDDAIKIYNTDQSS